MDIVNTMLEVRHSTTENYELKENERFVYLRDANLHKGDGLACIVTIPSRFPNVAKLVLMIHGSLSHKNAIYQPLLAERLADLGFFSIRLDFRGLGDSEDAPDPSVGRTIANDVDDIKLINDALQDTTVCQSLFGASQLQLYAIVAHSRGSLAMFNFVLNLETGTIPLLVNCSGRFDGNGLLDRCNRNHPGWQERGGTYATTLRYGRLQKVWMPKTETLSVIQVNTEIYSKITKQSSIVSIYGTDDEIVPPIDASLAYATVFKGHHRLIYIDGAGHNFYGGKGDLNVNNLPYKRGLVNYNVELVRCLYNIFASTVEMDQNK